MSHGQPALIQMLKIAEYRHTEHSFKSVFRLPDVSSNGTSFMFTSDECGLGWFFAIGVTIRSTSNGGQLEESSLAAVIMRPGSVDRQFWPLSVSFGVENMDVRPHLRSSGPYGPMVADGRRPSLLVHRLVFYDRSWLKGSWWFVVSSPVPMALPAPSPVIVALRAPNHHVQALLTEAISNGAFNDTRFYAYSRRSTSGRVCQPRPLFASSSILEAQAAKESSDGESYFRALLFGPSFMESFDTTLRDDTVPSTRLYADNYDYDSDSDLEDDKDSSITDTGASVGLSAAGRTIFIEDAAYTTWHALILYLYTGHVSFKPLRSESAGCGSASSTFPDLSVPPNRDPSRNVDRLCTVQCSPKSMYRLADKLGLPYLEILALEAIKASITINNIVQEVFSSFSSRYDTIREKQVDFLFNFLELPKVSEDLCVMMGRVATGELPHSKEAVTTIMHRLLNVRMDLPPAEPVRM
ncbi:hypothetical protein OE88DRAFT_1732748 [Heliocybe sulcata]|uniref:BTB domain-containing protein n=1 Tax=Heliocybe sulcata TaxID=5364 RepID=A0A5C3NK85_9AGAM|nr:hypothetical protein OE88DRAFT_1732748 [Heliocybe sulcata]